MAEDATNSSTNHDKWRPNRSVAPGWARIRTDFKRATQISHVTTFVGARAPRFRSLRVSSFFLALSGVGSVLLVHTLGANDVADIVALRIVAYACWLYGALGFWVLLSPKSLQEPGAQLLRMRGVQVQDFRFWSLGVTRRLSLGMCVAGLPGVIAAALVSPNLPTFAQRIGLILVAAIYLVSLGALLSMVGVMCRRLSPQSPRSFALTIILVPFLLSFAYEGVPSIPGAYSWALGQMIQWGGDLK